MDLTWLEDYIALRESGSFTAAAKRRNTSQPAFSRRIQALEGWLGVTLVDRSSRPPTFTHLAIENEAEIRTLLNHILDLRSRLKGEQARSGRVRLAVQHALSLTVLPSFLGKKKAADLYYTFWLSAGDRAECINMLLHGDAELLICYESDKYTASIPESIASRHVLSRDAMVLVGKPLENGQTFGGDRRLPMLSYPQTNFFGRIVWDQLMPELAANYEIETLCVSGFSSAIKELCLIGMGVAWLPHSLIDNELARGDLVLFQDKSMRVDLDVSLFIQNLNTSAEQRRMWRSVFRSFR